MQVIDPGHIYELSVLDQPRNWFKRLFFRKPRLVFVKRKGDKFPGNLTSHPGTTMQEVLRACIYRVAYLNNQKPDARNAEVAHHLQKAIHELEARAAEMHGRPVPEDWISVYGSQCPHCLHVGCGGECHTPTNVIITYPRV